MAEFKSSFMGGYNKKSVDEYLAKLESENETLKKALDLAEHNALKVDKYQNEAAKLKNRVAELEKKLEESEESNSDYISSIGQIFYSAYESGAKITDDAKAGSQEFLQKIESVSAQAKAEAQKAISAYNLINTDVKALLANLTKEINAVSANTDAMIKKAILVAESMDDIQNIKTENANKANAVAEEYKEFFDSFSTNEKSQTVKTTEKVAEPVLASTPAETAVVEEKKAEAPIDSQPAPTPAQPIAQQIKEEPVSTASVQNSTPPADRNALLRDMLKRVQNNNEQ